LRSLHFLYLLYVSKKEYLTTLTIAKMAKKLTAKGTFKTKKAKVEVQVPVFEFTEDDVEIIYCPSLDLSGYGKTLKEAEDSFEIVLGEFLDYTTIKGTLVKELKSLG